MTIRPRCVIRLADADDVYLSWRWNTGHAISTAVRPGAQVRAALTELHAALPSGASGLSAALTTGALARYETGYPLAQLLSAALLPSALMAQVREHAGAIHPQLCIQPSPLTAQVPWELLPAAPDAPLLELADVSLLAPRSIVQSPYRTPQAWTPTTSAQPIVAILDPRVPGHAADSPLGSVLGRPSAEGPIATAFHRHQARGRIRAQPLGAGLFRRTDTDRDWLSSELRSGASRLIYVGHVTAALPESGQSEHAQLHLACGAGTTGFAAVSRGHRPFTAKDLLLSSYGTATAPESGAQRWPMPARVALIGCESGADLRFGEALGLVAAIMHNGAELVTATRWTLPTDLAFARHAPQRGAPLQEAVVAIDAAHESADPVHTIAAWQRTQFARWRAGDGSTPLLWGAFGTVIAT